MGEYRTIAIAAGRRLGLRLGRSSLSRDERGVAVVEFSLVAVPLFALIAVIMEASFLVFAQHNLDVAVERGARILRTGAFQAGATAEDPSARLRRALCGGGVSLFSCSDVRIDLSRTQSFSPTQVAAPYDAKTGNWADGFGARFDCPSGGSIVSLRIAVPVLRPFRFLDYTGQKMPDGRQLLTSTMVFRTESFEDKSC